MGLTVASKAKARTNLTLCERQGFSFIVAPSTANMSYRKPLYAGKFFPSCDSQVKAKFTCPCHEDAQGECRYSSTNLNVGKTGGKWWSDSSRGCFTRCSLCRRLCGHRSGTAVSIRAFCTTGNRKPGTAD